MVFSPSRTHTRGSAYFLFCCRGRISEVKGRGGRGEEDGESEKEEDFVSFANYSSQVERRRIGTYGLVSTIGVTNLGLEVVLVLQEVVSVSLHVGPLAISVYIHLDNTVLDSGLDLFLGRSRSSVEDEVDGERVLRLELLVSVLLVLREELGLELNVSDALATRTDVRL